MGCKVGESIITWDSTKYTTDIMSREIYNYLCDKRNRPRTYFENEVKSLIEKGPLTEEELKYFKCSCLNQSQIKGECRLGACIVIRNGGWSVSINVPPNTPHSRVGTITDRDLWSEPKTPISTPDVCTSVDFTYDQNTHVLFARLHGQFSPYFAFEIWRPSHTDAFGNFHPAAMMMAKNCHSAGMGGATVTVQWAGNYTLKYSCGLSCVPGTQTPSSSLVQTKTIYCPYP